VGDAGRGLTALSARLQGENGFALIPQMDAVVMSRMIGNCGEDLIEQGIDGLMAGDGSLGAGKPDAPDEEGFGFDVLGVVLDETFEVFDAVEAALFFVALVIAFAVEGFEGGDPLLLAWGGLGFERRGFLDEGTGALFVVHVGHAHAPVGHGAVGIDGGDLTEGALGLVIPEAVKLADSLGEEGLRVGLFGTDGEFDRVTAAGNEHGGLTRAFVKGFTMCGVAGEFVGVKRECEEEGESDEGAHGQA
jgi:hypothetical protein